MSKPIASKDFEAVNAKPLAGKVALVTAGAAIAKELADQGAARGELRRIRRQGRGDGEGA
jgi:hypothetical protein